jgi:hypothetical protein
MQTLTIDGAASRVPNWLWAVSALGVLWNAYGLYQFVGTFTPAGQAAMTAGMTTAQAEVYLGLPVWISVLLFADAAYHGVFTAIPGQLAILAVVVLIAVGLFWASRIAVRRGLLR